MASEIRVTNIKANDGTDSLTVANSTGNVSLGGTLATTGNTTVGGTLTSTGAITASGGIANSGTITAGTLGSSVVFPAGTVLQVKHHHSTAGFSVTGGSETRYLESDGDWETGGTSAWGNITLKKANSSLLFMIDQIAYWTSSAVGGAFARCESHIRYSTTNSSLGSPTDTARFISTYIDARSTNNTAGQEERGACGSHLLTTSSAKDTVYYYTIKTICNRSGIFDHTQLVVMELAT